MKTFKENDIVIYTDSEGNRFDTFVIFGTDPKTGCTHINHYNLKVPVSDLEIHPRSLTGNTIPMADMLSFNLFNKLKEKYTRIDQQKKTNTLVLHKEIAPKQLLHKAS
jgi:hypothetical protein